MRTCVIAFIAMAVLFVKCGPTNPYQDNQDHSFFYIEVKRESHSEVLAGNPPPVHMDMGYASIGLDTSTHLLYTNDTAFRILDTTNFLFRTDVFFSGICEGTGSGEMQVGIVPYAFLHYSYQFLSHGFSDSIHMDTAEANHVIITYRGILKDLAVGDSMVFKDSLIDSTRNSTSNVLMWVEKVKETETYYNRGRFTNKDIR